MCGRERKNGTQREPESTKSERNPNRVEQRSGRSLTRTTIAYSLCGIHGSMGRTRVCQSEPQNAMEYMTRVRHVGDRRRNGFFSSTIGAQRWGRMRKKRDTKNRGNPVREGPESHLFR